MIEAEMKEAPWSFNLSLHGLHGAGQWEGRDFQAGWLHAQGFKRGAAATQFRLANSQQQQLFAHVLGASFIFLAERHVTVSHAFGIGDGT